MLNGNFIVQPLLCLRRNGMPRVGNVVVTRTFVRNTATTRFVSASRKCDSLLLNLYPVVSGIRFTRVRHNDSFRM